MKFETLRKRILHRLINKTFSNAEMNTGQAEVDNEKYDFLMEDGFLDGYGVPAHEVLRLIRVKDESTGEPVRVGGYNREQLGMKDFEILFALRSVFSHVPKDGRVMDVASGSSLLPLFYSTLGFRAVHQDVHPLSFDYPGVENIVCDVIDLANQCEPESFDAISMICAMEHFGLGRYGDKMDASGDFKAVEYLEPLLKIGGILVVTVPFGPPALVYNTHRVYNYQRLKIIFEGFEIVEEKYRVWPDWAVATRRDAEEIILITEGKRPSKNHSLALWVLRKPLEQPDV